jgi:hypothetical protein
MQIEILLEPRYPPTSTQSTGQARLLKASQEASQERKSFDDSGGPWGFKDVVRSRSRPAIMYEESAFSHRTLLFLVHNTASLYNYLSIYFLKTRKYNDEDK